MTLDMCDRPLFFTDRGERRTGGIIVAGLNWGAANGLDEVQAEMRTATWSPSAFFQIDDSFRAAMTKRFAAWGHDPRLEREFDSALVATNLFYNTTHGSSSIGADAEDWDRAISRLFSGAASVDASAVIIAARLALAPLSRFLSKKGPSPRWSEASGNWQTCRHCEMEIALGPHYRARAGLASNAAIKSAAPAMSASLDRAMVRFRKMRSC